MKAETEMGKQLRSTKFDRAYYEEHKAAGLDYMVCGGWQERYGRWFVESLGLKGKSVLDVGCACGSIVKGLAKAGAVVQGIDVNAYMIGLAVGSDPGMGKVLHVGSAEELPFEDGSFDAVHCAQVAEHWEPGLVPKILGEIVRVLKPGGYFFNCLDTEEMYARQGRKLETEDPTHWCVKPKAWWQRWHGFLPVEDVTEAIKSSFDLHPASMTREYDWDYFVLKKRL